MVRISIKKTNIKFTSQKAGLILSKVCNKINYFSFVIPYLENSVTKNILCQLVVLFYSSGYYRICLLTFVLRY